MTGALAGWRAVLRVARRDARRHLGRSSLVALMVLVPVLAATVGAVLARSADLDPQDRAALRLGAGPVQAVVDGLPSGVALEQSVTGDGVTMLGQSRPTPISSADVLPRVREALAGPGDSVVPEVTSGSRLVRVDGRAVRTDVAEVDYPGLGRGGPVEQETGRAPAADDEVVVSRQLARAEHLHVGDRLSYADGGGSPREYTVVGTVTGSRMLGTRSVVGRPGALLDAALVARDNGYRYDLSWYVVGPTPVTWTQVRAANAFGAVVVSRAVVADPPPGVWRGDEGTVYVEPETIAIGGVVLGLMLLQIGLMVGPAVAVGARRNERLLAVLAASGAAPRHIAGVVLAGAGVVGLVASLAGASAGTVVGGALVAVLRDRFGAVLPRADVRASDLALLVLVGTLTTTAAAVLPARRVARLDVVAALTGRRTQTAPLLALPLTGGAVLVVGLLVAWWQSGSGHQTTTVLALGTIEVGLVMASTAVVALLARLAGRAPLTLRFALRDAARQRSRTAPALAATVAAVAGAMCALVFIPSSNAARSGAYFAQAPRGAVYVGLTLGGGPGTTTADVGAVEAALRATLPVRDVAPVLSIAAEPGADSFLLAEMRSDCDGDGTCSSGSIEAKVVDPADAAVLSPRPEEVRAALEAGRAVTFDQRLVQPGGTASVVVQVSPVDGTTPPTERRSTVPVVLLAGPDRLDGILLPRSVATGLGLRLEPRTLVARTTRPVDRVALEQARSRLSTLSPDLLPAVERGPRDDVSPLVPLLVIGLAVLVALVGTFTAVGLAAADARTDLGTLAAVGADPALRRRIGAAQAATIAVPGAVLGTVAGIVGAWILVRLNGSSSYYSFVDWQVTVPAGPAAALVVGLPALAVALGWLTVRSRLDVVRRLGE